MNFKGDCGSCYAFASVSFAKSMKFIFLNGIEHFVN